MFFVIFVVSLIATISCEDPQKVTTTVESLVVDPNKINQTNVSLIVELNDDSQHHTSADDEPGYQHDEEESSAPAAETDKMEMVTEEVVQSKDDEDDDDDFLDDAFLNDLKLKLKISEKTNHHQDDQEAKEMNDEIQADKPKSKKQLKDDDKQSEENLKVKPIRKLRRDDLEENESPSEPKAAKLEVPNAGEGASKDIHKHHGKTETFKIIGGKLLLHRQKKKEKSEDEKKKHLQKSNYNDLDHDPINGEINAKIRNAICKIFDRKREEKQIFEYLQTFVC